MQKKTENINSESEQPSACNDPHVNGAKPKNMWWSVVYVCDVGVNTVDQ